MWRDDLVIWEREIEQALADSKQLEDALRAHRKALQDHLEATGAQEQTLYKHERALAEYERGGPGEDLLPMAKVHKENAEKHAKHAAAHERLKRHHHTVMAHWSLLLEALARMRL
jgi:hypothetical protein